MASWVGAFSPDEIPRNDAIAAHNTPALVTARHVLTSALATAVVYRDPCSVVHAQCA